MFKPGEIEKLESLFGSTRPSSDWQGLHEDVEDKLEFANRNGATSREEVTETQKHLQKNIKPVEPLLELAMIGVAFIRDEKTREWPGAKAAIIHTCVIGAVIKSIRQYLPMLTDGSGDDAVNQKKAEVEQGLAVMRERGIPALSIEFAIQYFRGPPDHSKKSDSDEQPEEPPQWTKSCMRRRAVFKNLGL